MPFAVVPHVAAAPAYVLLCVCLSVEAAPSCGVGAFDAPLRLPLHGLRWRLRLDVSDS